MFLWCSLRPILRFSFKPIPSLILLNSVPLNIFTIFYFSLLWNRRTLFLWFSTLVIMLQFLIFPCCVILRPFLSQILLFTYHLSFIHGPYLMFNPHKPFHIPFFLIPNLWLLFEPHRPSLFHTLLLVVWSFQTFAFPQTFFSLTNTPLIFFLS